MIGLYTIYIIVARALPNGLFGLLYCIYVRLEIIIDKMYFITLSGSWSVIALFYDSDVI